MYYTIYQKRNGKISRQLHLTNNASKVNEIAERNCNRNQHLQFTTLLLNKHNIVRLLKITFGLKPSYLN